MAKNTALGRGLGALIDDGSYEVQKGNRGLSGTSEIPVSSIRANPFQPRKEFDPEALEELSRSIRELGIIQPVTVRKTDQGYELISGERRFRAAQMAGLENLPAYVRQADDKAMLELALVENIQREDLNPLEVAFSYERLIHECGLTHDTMSARVGKKRSTITNYLRLLKLPDALQAALRDRRLDMGHARALAGIDDAQRQMELFGRVLELGLSVRETERLARGQAQPAPKASPKEPALPGDFAERRSWLSQRLQTKVEVRRDGKGKGKIVIGFDSDQDFHRLLELLQGQG